ncbi:HlyC/CorC family transporter [bacterium]|nr:HlyC/CorC family transporter [bacterium]
MIALILSVSIVIIMCGISSGVEAALFSISEIKVRQLAEKGGKRAQILKKIKLNITRPIAMLVIVTNLTCIGGSILVGSIASKTLGNQWLGVVSGILTLLVILFSEIIPKTLGERYSETISLMAAYPISILTWILFPIIWCLEILTKPLTSGKSNLTTNEMEIRLLARIGKQEGVIEEDEFLLIQRAFLLNDTFAKDILTPRTIIESLSSSMSLNDAKDKILADRHSRIVITGESIDEVKGIALKVEMLSALAKGESETKLMKFCRKPYYFDLDERADKMLEHFQHSREHLAIVQDGYGGVAGVVSLEDVLEVLTGEIIDENDRIADLRELAKKHRNNSEESE